MARSPYTRRAGTVALVDVAPTILDLLGIDRPHQMEGRAIESARTDGPLDNRIAVLVDINGRSILRDRAITQAGGVFVGCAFTLAGLAVIVFARRRTRDHVVTALELAALALLFFLPATFVAGGLYLANGSLAAYWWFVIGASVIAAVGALTTSRRRSLAPLVIALVAVVGLIVVDVLTGARLQFNGAFGYSATIGGRYAGLGNLGFAQLAVGALLLAAIAVHLLPRRAALWIAGGIFGVAIVVDGAPYFGADVGGVLAMVPAFGITFAMLCGWRFRWRLIATFTAAAIVVLGIFAAVDLARPPDDRTHLGRLLAGNGGDLWIVFRRKLAANLSIITANPLAVLLPLVFLAAAYYIWRAPGRLGVTRSRMPSLSAALAGVGTVAVLGTGLNDSGLKITGMMFGVLVAGLVVLCARVGLDERAPHDAAHRVRQTAGA